MRGRPTRQAKGGTEVKGTQTTPERGGVKVRGIRYWRMVGVVVSILLLVVLAGGAPLAGQGDGSELTGGEKGEGGPALQDEVINDDLDAAIQEICNILTREWKADRNAR